MFIGDLRQRRVQDRDVVGGVVGARVARPQLRGQELAGVVQRREHRVVAEAALNVAAACCFSEWVITMLASRSMRNSATTRPAVTGRAGTPGR